MDLGGQLQTSLGERYRLERELRAGGMARVFVARETALDRRVVIKVLAPGVTSVVFADRFRREVALAARLRHPHIIPLLTAGDAGGLLYYTMPFVEGETLADRLERHEGIPLVEGLRLLREIGSALAYAHSHGIIHRDIKPENILIENGHAVVADFGIAKALATAAVGVDGALPAMTTAGVVMGTVTYMAPEQAAADPGIDHRADLYAVGVVAYEMFAGGPPFQGTPQQVLAAHIATQPAPFLSRCPGHPPVLGDLVMQLLAKEPTDRPETAAHFVQRIDAIMSSADLATAEASRSRVRSPRGERTFARAKRLLVSRPVATVMVGLALGATGIAGYRALGGTPGNGTLPAAGPLLGPKSVAVLPFVDAGRDATNEHFAHGLTDELIAVLGQVPGLTVAARTSVFALSGSGFSPAAIADSLGVAATVEVSVRREGSRFKITAQLMRAADRSVLWSDVFDREVRDLFAVQEEIARAIAVALNVRLGAETHWSLMGRATHDLAAYELYLKAQYEFARPGRDRAGMESTLAHLQNAVARDSTFPLPYPMMAFLWVNLSNFRYASFDEAMRNAGVAADRAVRLDSLLPEAHAAKAYVGFAQGRYREAEKGFLRALELNPSAAETRHYYSLLLMALDRTDQALTQNRMGTSLDPLFAPLRANRGIILSQQGNYSEARRELTRAIPAGPKLPFLWYGLAQIEAAEGRYSEASTAVQRADSISPDWPGLAGLRALVYRKTGLAREADRVMERARRIPDDDLSRTDLALAEAVAGNTSRAYDLLAQGARFDIPAVIDLRANPLLAGFRSDPRYPALLMQIGLTRGN
jgi:TolB-like protein/tRNA A-37 threonylcarbamoyl transferase component Bud32/Flp pilus assembly protein TadD